MSEDIKNKLDRFLTHRVYSFGVSNPDESVSVLDDALNYGVEKLSREDANLLMRFLLKFCTIDKEDIGLALKGTYGGGKEGKDFEIARSMEDLVGKLFDFLTDVENLFIGDSIPKDADIRLNLKSAGETLFYGDKTDLWSNDDGLKAHLVVKDGKISAGLGFLDDADEIGCPTDWIMNLFFGAVDASEIKNEKVKEYIKYSNSAIPNLISMVIKDPKDVVLSDAWLSDAKKRWNSDDEKVNSLKDDISAVIRLEEIPSVVYPDIDMILDISKDKLSQEEITRIKELFEKGAVSILLSSKDGKIDLKFLDEKERPSVDMNVKFLYDGLVRYVYGEMSLMRLVKEPYVFITTPGGEGRGKKVFGSIIGLDLLMKELLRGILLPIPVKKEVI
ncbi:hypothetical protein [Candidatus Methanoliparum sp. LAM-1]|uniref:hypothetical protein n=1 Tax=Candidatus Methanoliparum sp. LAM-1 TaxID=2874846 RepID=UPI001E5FD072|nr:hypothetical protein [Candidatus Methanoliparum sp. LAM-1]BDC35320.1 hypothetical protein MTLP_00020 [Candidatus Methanoliparum sp. LAM-1]